MKKASEVLGLKVLGIREGQDNGYVEDFVADPQTKRIEYLILKAGRGYAYEALNITDVAGIGADYVMTQSAENTKKIYESRELLEKIEKGFLMLGTTVLVSSGNVAGQVKDFSFDEKTGVIETLYLDSQEEFPGGKIVTLAGEMVFLDMEMRATAEAEHTVETEMPQPEEPKIQEPEEQKEAALPFEAETVRFLTGKVLKETVRSADGTFAVEAGTVLDEDILGQAAKYDGMLLELTVNI